MKITLARWDRTVQFVTLCSIIANILTLPVSWHVRKAEFVSQFKTHISSLCRVRLVPP